MSSVIDYTGEAEGFRSSEERREFVELAEKFQDAHVTENEEKGIVWFSVPSGWRGAGLSCKEIVQDHFGSWLDEHPQVTCTVRASYVEQAPTEVVLERGEDDSR